MTTGGSTGAADGVAAGHEGMVKEFADSAEARRLLALKVRSLPDADEEQTDIILCQLVSATRIVVARSDLVHDANNVPILLASLARYSSSHRVVVATLDILQNIADTPEHCRIIVKDGAVPAIAQIMKMYFDDVKIAEMGCAALCDVGSYVFESSKTIISPAEGMLGIVHTMRRHSSSESLQEDALWLLRNLANIARSNKIDVSGIIPPVLDSMSKHEFSEGVQREGCATLRNLGFLPDSQIAVAVCGGILSIERACIVHSRSEDVLKHGLGALVNLTFSPAALAVMVERVGRLKVVLKTASFRYPDSCSKYSKVILRHLSSADKSCARPWPLPFNAVDSVLESEEGAFGGAKEFSPTLQILSHIYRLSGCPESAEAESVTITDAINDSRTSKEIIVTPIAMQGLVRMSCSKKHRIAISVAGGIRALIGTMCDRTNSFSIQRGGCLAIQNLSYNEENDAAICSAGGIAGIVAAMENFPNDSGLQRRACAALRNLSASNNKIRNKIRDGRGIKALCAALSNHSVEAPVLAVACSALGNLCLENNGNRRAIAVSDGIELIVAALKAHPDCPVVQEKGCRALHYLALNKENLIAIQDRGIEIVLWHSFSKFPTKCGGWVLPLLDSTFADWMEATHGILVRLSDIVAFPTSEKNEVGEDELRDAVEDARYLRAPLLLKEGSCPEEENSGAMRGQPADTFESWSWLGVCCHS